MATAADRAWFWNGHQATEWPLALPPGAGMSAGHPTVTERSRQWFLSAGGDSLFRIETSFEQILDDSGGERSVRSTGRVLRTSLSGDHPAIIAKIGRENDRRSSRRRNRATGSDTADDRGHRSCRAGRVGR